MPRLSADPKATGDTRHFLSIAFAAHVPTDFQTKGSRERALSTLISHKR